MLYDLTHMMQCMLLGPDSECEPFNFFSPLIPTLTCSMKMRQCICLMDLLISPFVVCHWCISHLLDRHR